MSKLKGLGTNFESLVPKGINIDLVATDSEHKIHMLPLLSIQPRQDQPRKNFNDLELEKLAQSIKEQGILQPIIVTETEQNNYSIVAGERRWRAANIVGLNTIPAIIKKVNDFEHFQLAVLENVQRQDLSAIEFAISINRLHQDYQQSYEDIAKNLGKAYTTVVNTARLLKLPMVMQESIVNGTISEGHGRALLSLEKHTDKQKKLYINILKNYGKFNFSSTSTSHIFKASLIESIKVTGPTICIFSRLPTFLKFLLMNVLSHLVLSIVEILE